MNGKVPWKLINAKLKNLYFEEWRYLRFGAIMPIKKLHWLLKSVNVIGGVLTSVPCFMLKFCVRLHHIPSDEPYNPGGFVFSRRSSLLYFCYFCLCVIFLCYACEVEKARHRHRQWPNYPELFNLAEGLITTPWD